MLNIVGGSVVVALRCCMTKLLADVASDVLAFSSALVSLSFSFSFVDVVVVPR